MVFLEARCCGTENYSWSFLEKKEAKTWPVYFSRSSSNKGFDTKSKFMEERKGAVAVLM